MTSDVSLMSTVTFSTPSFAFPSSLSSSRARSLTPRDPEILGRPSLPGFSLLTSTHGLLPAFSSPVLLPGVRTVVKVGSNELEKSGENCAGSETRLGDGGRNGDALNLMGWMRSAASPDEGAREALPPAPVVSADLLDVRTGGRVLLGLPPGLAAELLNRPKNDILSVDGSSRERGDVRLSRSSSGLCGGPVQRELKCVVERARCLARGAGGAGGRAGRYAGGAQTASGRERARGGGQRNFAARRISILKLF